MGKAIGISRFSISNYESGKRVLTERVIRDLCREFNVEYEWLTEGEGEMFHSLTNGDIVGKLGDIMEGQNEFAKRFVKAMAELPEEDWLVIERLINELGGNQ